MTDKEVIEWCRKSLQDSKPVFWMDKLTKWERVAAKVLLAVSVLPVIVILWFIAQILTWMIEQQF